MDCTPTHHHHMAVKNKLESDFFKMLKKHFPPTNKLYKIFNKNTIKLSHSSMSNVTSNINKI